MVLEGRPGRLGHLGVRHAGRFTVGREPVGLIDEQPGSGRGFPLPPAHQLEQGLRAEAERRGRSGQAVVAMGGHRAEHLAPGNAVGRGAGDLG